MIIACKSCYTRYQFDDTLIRGEGVWLKCNRCDTHFFFPNPKPQPPMAPPPEPEKQETTPGKDQTIRLNLEPPPVREAAPETLFPDDIQKDTPQGEMQPAEEDDAAEEAPGAVQGKPKTPWFSWRLITLIITINVLLGIGIYLWAFPEMGQQIFSTLSEVPYIGKYLAPETQPGDVNPGLIRIKDVSRRLADNFFSGTLLVLEGKAVNKSDEILTRIRIQGKLYDTGDKILRIRVSYSGNILNDSELATFSEEEILKKLSTPQDGNMAKDRLPPNGEIPFMIVFALDRAGIPRNTPVIKTGVIPMSAERLLP